MEERGQDEVERYEDAESDECAGHHGSPRIVACIERPRHPTGLAHQAGGLKANREHFEPQLQLDDAGDPARRALLFDPQTSGGLLLLVPAENAEALLADLPSARRIGRALPAGPKRLVIV